MKLISTDFEDGGNLPAKFSCQEEGISPALTWSEVPAEAKSLALSLVDPDAPGGNFVHWLLINIPIATCEIPKGETIGDELPNTSGSSGYVPPCPPFGKHRYVFTLYALKMEKIDPASVSNFEATIQPLVIEKAQITALFQKTKI